MGKQRKGVVTHIEGGEGQPSERKPRTVNPLTKAAGAVAAAARERKRYSDLVESLRNKLQAAENNLDAAASQYESAKRQLSELAGE